MRDHVEIHVPLVPGGAGGDHPYPWIDRVEEFLCDLEEQGMLEVFDDGEEWGETYIFFIAGAKTPVLLEAASRVAALDEVPAGAFAMVTNESAADFGMGRRVELGGARRSGEAPRSRGGSASRPRR